MLATCDCCQVIALHAYAPNKHFLTDNQIASFAESPTQTDLTLCADTTKLGSQLHLNKDKKKPPSAWNMRVRWTNGGSTGNRHCTWPKPCGSNRNKPDLTKRTQALAKRTKWWPQWWTHALAKHTRKPKPNAHNDCPGHTHTHNTSEEQTHEATLMRQHMHAHAKTNAHTQMNHAKHITTKWRAHWMKHATLLCSLALCQLGEQKMKRHARLNQASIATHVVQAKCEHAKLNRTCLQITSHL